MRSLAELLQTQRGLETTYYEFLNSLDQSRTVTLSQLLTEPQSLKKLNIERWFNQQLFRQRTEAACRFLDRTSRHFPLHAHTPMVFFQSSRRHEDLARHWWRLSLKDYNRYREIKLRLQPEVGYLHTDTSFFHEMKGSWERSGRTIMATAPYCNGSWEGVYPSYPGFGVRSGSIIGFRIPKYPRVLGVSGNTATDYTTRFVLHDLGHFLLPPVEERQELLHNSVMIQAMDVQMSPHESAWEALVHRECTDPCFILDAPALFKAVNASSLGRTHQYFLNQLRKEYLGTNRAQILKQLWGINDERSTDARCQYKRALQELPETSFARYRAAA